PKLTDLGVKTIAQSKTIVSLYLDDTAISDSAIDYLASAGKLITFSMKGCKNIEGRSIGRLKKLGILLLARSGFKPANCGQLKELTNLAILDLCDLDIRNKDVANLEGLKVQDLKLSNNPKLTDSCLHSLEKMNLLKKVDLSGCSGISENARKNFANQSASSLKVIVSGDSDAGKI
ncbi:MAG: hypothetical protein K8F91_07400, partial [Candidatus Obscuribacterales bacterium]|nr:hypothetical protein [Candidatus Obscuribacterales bacterium]